MAESLSTRLGDDSHPANTGDTPPVVVVARVAPADFERVVSGYQECVARLASRLLGWSQDVDDVVQEVFLAVLKGLPKFRGHSRLDTWVIRITINKCRTHRRRQLLRLRWRTGSGADRFASAAAPADQGTMDQEVFEQVRDAVRALPARYREVVVLHYLEQMSVDTIAESLGTSRNVVEVRLHRARARLKDRLSGLVEE